MKRTNRDPQSGLNSTYMLRCLFTKGGLVLAGVTLFFLCLTGSFVYAANVEIVGLDPRSAAMGGAYTAVADSPSAWYYNPAGLAQIRGGWQDLGVSQVVVFGAKYRDREGGPTYHDTTPIATGIYLPGCGNYGMEKVTIGIGGGVVLSGINYWSDTEGNLRYSGYEAMMMINTLTPTIAYQVTPSIMVGFGLNLAFLNKLTSRQRLGDGYMGTAIRATAKKALGFPPGQRGPIDDVLDLLGVNSVNGNDDGKMEFWTDQEFPTGMPPFNTVNIDFRHVSYILGILVKPAHRWRVGITYREQLDSNFEGQARITLEEDVKGIVNNNPLLVAFNGGPLDTQTTRFRTKASMPRMVVLGASCQVTDRLLLATDLQWVNWSAAWDRQILDLEGNGVLGVTRIVNQQDCKDTFTGRVGAEYRLWKGLFCQAGYWWDPTPIPDRTLSGGSMDSNRHVFSFGLAYRGLFDGTLDISTVFQFFLRQTRTIEPGASINLFGTRDYVVDGPAYNDFPVEYGGYMINTGAILSYHY